MKYSIITSTYNQKEQLIRCFEAIKKQTYNKLMTEVEWIIGDDGSSDGTREWVEQLIVDNFGKTFDIKYIRQDDNGYRLVEILNAAGEIAVGDYLVWIMGDSYPKEDFLEQIDKYVAPDKMHNGIRMNVNAEGQIVGQDWRIARVGYELEEWEEFEIINPRSWEMMTLNSMIMPRHAYQLMGGICPSYKGYGQMDWDMAAWSHYNHMKLCWITKAVIYHEAHPEKADTPGNIEVFAKRLVEFQAPELAKQQRTKEKMEIINDPQRAVAKAKMIADRIAAAERAAKEDLL